MKLYFRGSLFLALTFLLCNCQPKEQRIHILSTTDVHGAFFPIDPITGEAKNGSLAHVSQHVKTLRKQENTSTILLDNGDIIQGDPSIYYYNFEDTLERHLFTQTMHYLKYDAATVGNHDIEAGHPVYDRILAELNIPWLAANCIDTRTQEPYFEPYTIIHRGKLKIAVLGLITPRIPDWLPENIWANMYFEDMVIAAKAWVPKIMAKEKPDLLIGLFHAGLDYDYNAQDENTPKNENAVRLVAQQVPGFDVIFAGHDHKLWNEYELNTEGDSVLLLGAGSGARNLALAEISMQRSGRKWEIIQRSGTIISMGDVEPDPDYINHFSTQIEEVTQYVNQEVGELKTTLATAEAFFGPSAFMTFIHEVQLSISQAEISFAAPLSYNAFLPAKTITVFDLFQLYRFENLLYTMELSGQEILDYLNYSYSLWFNSMQSQNDHMIHLLPDGNGRLRTAAAYYNFESAQGLNYEVDLRQPAGNMVRITGLSNGEAFDFGKKYQVAINSYRGNGGGGHLTQGAGIPHDQLSGRLLRSTDKDLRFHMKQYIEEQGMIEVSISKNWRVIPEAWAISGREKDYKILFRN